MAAPQRVPRRRAETRLEGEQLAPISPRLRSRLGTGIAAVGILAVVLVAAGAPGEVRAPIVLVAALLLPGFPIVARLPLDLPTLLAVDVCGSLALEAGGALLTVEARLWHPQILGLALAVFGVGGTFVALTHLRHEGARHLQ